MVAALDLPTNFRRLRLELAREPGRPEGDRDDAYLLVVPLLSDGRLDPVTFEDHRDACRAVRETPDGERRSGRMVRGPGGRWLIRYGEDEDVDVGFRFDQERFVPGEYISLTHDGVEHTYRVVTREML